MAKPEWGTKRICHSCGAMFYDLRRDPIVCPKCGAQYDPEQILKSRRSRAALPDEKDVEPAVVEDEEAVAAREDEVLEDDALEVPADELAADEDEEDQIEDASELGGDDDDMAEVIEHIDGEDER